VALDAVFRDKLNEYFEECIGESNNENEAGCEQVSVLKPTFVADLNLDDTFVPQELSQVDNHKVDADCQKSEAMPGEE